MLSPRHLAAGLAVTIALLAAGSTRVSSAPAAPAFPQAKPALGGNRAPYDLVFSTDGKRAYVTESAEGAVAVIDVPRMAVIQRIPTGGEEPTNLALTPDGKTLLVSNSFSGSVALLDLEKGEPRAVVPLRGMPYGIAVMPDGRRAFVAVSQLDEVAVIDLSAAEVVRRIPVGRRPRALTLSADGMTLAVANLAGGSVSVVNTETLAEEAQVRLKGVNVRGIAATADGAEAYVSVMPPFNRKRTDDPKEIWHNLVQAVSLQGSSSTVAEDQWLDFARSPGVVESFGTPDPHDIVLDRQARVAWVSAAGRDVLTRISIHDPRRNTIWPFSQVDTLVGANPRGLALTPDEKQVWVANYLGNSLSVVDAVSGAVVKTLDLGPASRVDPSVAGQYLFNNAGMTRSHRFTCSSCHPDGAADGLTWSFVHVDDGMERRNTRDLRAGLEDTGPFRWSGFDKHLNEFVRSEVTGLLGGPNPTAQQEKALMEAVGALRLPPNPHRRPDGSLTEAAQRGESLFTGKAGCGSCHAGTKRGGSGLTGWVGTTREGKKLDVPHLTGVYDSAPYLHDGRAERLEEVFEKHNTAQQHGRYHTLTPEERADLLRFVREL